MQHYYALLEADEPAAFRVVREHGRSPFFVTCDHAGALVPRRLDSLGLSPQDLQRHIASDIGAAAIAARLAERLDAFLILQPWSRLVIDCNRPPGSLESIVAFCDGARIPGNESVSPVEAMAREREVFWPYHHRIASELAQRKAQRRESILIAVHSFTPRLHGAQRPWHAGVFYNRDPRFARALLRSLRDDAGLAIGDNEPYAASDSTDYTIPVHGEQRGLLHVGIEIRQDLIAAEAGLVEWSELIALALLSARARGAT